MIEMHIPENVKLWESPGRAWGLPLFIHDAVSLNGLVSFLIQEVYLVYESSDLFFFTLIQEA